MPGPTILAIEASADDSSLAARFSDSSLATSRWHAQRRHHAQIFHALAPVVPRLTAEMPTSGEVILVGTGPGSHGGVRVSLAAADGLSLVWNVPVAGICSWEALPVWFDPAQPDSGWMLGDARRGGWALCQVRHGSALLDQLQILPQDEALARVASLQADGQLVVSCEPADKLATAGFNSVLPGQIPQASLLISRWEKFSPQERAAIIASPPQPLYLRPPHITKSTKPLPQNRPSPRRRD